MAARTGEQFLRGLAGRRDLWVGGDKVSSVVDHPALSGAAHALAEVFDLQHRHAGVCLMPDCETGEPINISHMIPRSREDLQRRHRGLERIAEYSVGLMGRTPDYMNVTFAGFAGRADEWAINGNEQGAQNLVHYQKKLAREDLSLTHTIINSSVDMSKGKHPIGHDPVQLHKVEDTEHGILVRGSRVMATLAPFADELAVYPSGPMPDAAPAHALSFCIPMDTPGLKFLCRDSVAVNTNRFDRPLSSRFDEQDAFVIFDDVEVPRDRVFIDANLPVSDAVLKTTWWPNHMQQTMIRAQTKLEFAGAWQAAWPRRSIRSASHRFSRCWARLPCSPSSRAGPYSPRSRRRANTATACGPATCVRWRRCGPRFRPGFPAPTKSSASSVRTIC